MVRVPLLACALVGVASCTTVPDTGTGGSSTRSTTSSSGSTSASGSTSSVSSSSTGCNLGDPMNCGTCNHVCAAPYDTCTEGHCGDEVREVVGGGDAVCGVLWGGKLVCWGANWLGQLGDGTILGTDTCELGDGSTYACRLTPVPVVSPAGGDLVHVIHASSTYYTQCAVTSEGDVYCWGDNNNFGLGHAQSLDMACPNPGGAAFCNPTPTKVGLPGGVHAANVSVGIYHTCILSTAGDVYCWGANDKGEIGAPLATPKSITPVKVPLPASVEQVEVDEDVYSQSCALAGGNVWCWGANDGGGLGHDPAEDSPCGAGAACAYLPRKVETATGFLANIVQIGVGRGFGCALDNQGAVWCWGNDVWGILGKGTANVPRFKADKVTGGALPAKVSQLVTDRGNSAFAIDANGAVYAWGRNNYATLGSGKVGGGPGCNGECEWLPIATGLTNVAQLSSSANLALALLLDGSVVAWGDNSFGELQHLPGMGQDVAVSQSWVDPVPRPVKVP